MGVYSCIRYKGVALDTLRCADIMEEHSKIRRLTVSVARVAREYIEVLEAVLVVILGILTIIALFFLFRDLMLLNIESPWSEINIVVSDILVLVILIELTRSFIISSLGRERFLEGFIELGIIILIREIAVAVIAANIVNALMASIGATLLIIAFWIAKERIRGTRDREAHT